MNVHECPLYTSSQPGVCNTIGATSGARTAYQFRIPQFYPSFKCDCVAQYLVFRVVF